MSDAIDRLRAAIDADPAHRRRVEELKQEMRDAMTGEELTDERLEHLLYALNQYESLEEDQLTLDELRPPMSPRALERLRWCAGLLKWSEEWDFGDEFGGQLDMLPTMNLAASREAQEALLDEIARLRAELADITEHRDELIDRFDTPRDVDLKMLDVIATMWQDESIEGRHHARMLDALVLELQRLRALEGQIVELIAAGNREALWTYLVATAKVHDQQHDDE
jgi:hypothetical protein